MSRGQRTVRVVVHVAHIVRVAVERGRSGRWRMAQRRRTLSTRHAREARRAAMPGTARWEHRLSAAAKELGEVLPGLG